MRKSRARLLTCLSIILAAGAWTLQADDKTSDGWVSLFNGKDLTGWKASEKVEWKVEDGLIVTPPIRSHLFTDAEYKNFEFKADVMTTKGSNSGIYFHTKYEDTFPNTGIECQVNQTHTDPVKSGSLYFIVKRFETPAKDDEWYTQHIIVKGKSVTVKINDKVLYEYVEPDGVTGTRKIGKGSFALQAHDPKSVVKYKNIMVKPLAD